MSRLSDNLVFWRHLREQKKLGGYVRLLLWRHRHILAYVLLAGAVAFSIANVTSETRERRSAIIKSGSFIAVDACNRDFRATQSVRRVLDAASQRAERDAKDGMLTPSQLRRARAFYKAQLDLLVLPDCRLAANAITEDPNGVPKLPDPLYSGSPAEDQLPR